MLSKRELGTVLAALRRFQEVENLNEYENEIATDGGDYARLTFDEINELCDTLNGAYVVGERVYVDAGNWKGEGEVIANGPADITIRLDGNNYVLTTTHDNVYPREQRELLSRRPLTVEELRAALDGAKNPKAVVALCADDFTYSAFVETIDSTQTDKGDGDVGQFLLRLDSRSEVGRFLGGE